MLYTIGHSTHSATDFLTAVSDIDIVADVRSHPQSRANPQYNQNDMIEWLPNKYEWWPELGGWTSKHAELINDFLASRVDLAKYVGAFPKQHITSSTSATTGWTNTGLNDYQWYTILDEFQNGIDILLKRAATSNIAIMCSEALWYKCHRSMIADHIIWRGGTIQHIMPRFRKIKQPRCVLTFVDHSKFATDRLPAYEPVVIELWEKYARMHKL